MDYTYTVHGILQARILEWVAFPFSRAIFPTQGSNPGFPHCRQILYQLRHDRSQIISNTLSCCCCSVAESCPTLCDSIGCSMPSFPVLPYLPEFTQIHVQTPSNHLILCHPLLLLPSIFPRIRVFQCSFSGSSHQVAKVLELHYQSFQ